MFKGFIMIISVLNIINILYLRRTKNGSGAVHIEWGGGRGSFIGGTGSAAQTRGGAYRGSVVSKPRCGPPRALRGHSLFPLRSPQTSRTPLWPSVHPDIPDRCMPYTTHIAM